LDKVGTNNYRPISNLSFISKLIEKVLAMRIEEHNDLNDSYESDYRRGHSTETALLKVHCDIAEALDEQSMVKFIMFDSPPAFYVIDRPIILKRLQFSFGIKENALTWSKLDLTRCRSSYLCITGIRYRTNELLYVY